MSITSQEKKKILQKNSNHRSPVHPRRAKRVGCGAQVVNAQGRGDGQVQPDAKPQGTDLLKKNEVTERQIVRATD